jgi:dCTP deaminase
MFWSGEELARRLPSLIPEFDPGRVDCASYRLRLGEQGFVTSDRFSNGEPDVPPIQILSSTRPDSTINIHPGQFAFLLTEETVEVPSDAIALISMRAGLKFKGLINVSGFHVDPGWKGRLVFGVYNAGAKMLMLERGQELFLIVYASLDRVSSKLYVPHGGIGNREGIKLEWAEGMAGQVFSPMALQRKMAEVEDAQRELTSELADIKGRGRTWDAVILAFIGLILTVVVAVVASDFVKATLGDWMKSAIDMHVKNAREEVSKLPPEVPDTKKDDVRPSATNVQITVGSKANAAE